MKMECRLLDDGTGVILTRQPELINDNLYVSFIGAPEGATAIFDSEGDTYYSKTSEGLALCPKSMLRGTVSVTVALLDGSVRPKKWICEEIIAREISGGGTFIAPNDTNLPLTVAKLRAENSDLRQKYADVMAAFEKLQTRVTRLLEGYDLD